MIQARVPSGIILLPVDHAASPVHGPCGGPRPVAPSRRWGRRPKGPVEQREAAFQRPLALDGGQGPDRGSPDWNGTRLLRTLEAP
jgi:hypothetical protein